MKSERAVELWSVCEDVLATLVPPLGMRFISEVEFGLMLAVDVSATAVADELSRKLIDCCCCC